MNPCFINHETKLECTLDNPLILITDQKVQLMKDLVLVLEQVLDQHRSLLIIAQDYDDEVIQNLKFNKLQGILNVCAVKAPSFGKYRSEVLEDIAIITNGTVITYDSGMKLTNVTSDMLGTCNKVTITNESTTIIGGSGDVNTRVQHITEQLNSIPVDQQDSEFLVNFYKTRIAKLVGGIAVIHAGGTTELEMLERKDRIDDAVCATKAAIEEGVVPGGGLSFVNAGRSLSVVETNNLEEIALTALTRGTNSVACKICLNAGVDFYEAKVDGNFMYDVNNEVWTDFLDAGILNPTKCDRLAWENAISVVNLYLSTSCVITNKQDYKIV